MVHPEFQFVIADVADRIHMVVVGQLALAPGTRFGQQRLEPLQLPLSLDDQRPVTLDLGELGDYALGRTIPRSHKQWLTLGQKGHP